MIYTKSLLIPANTSKLVPATTTVKMTNGKITKMMVGFPYGCSALVHVQSFYQNLQIMPFSPEEDIAWDDYIFPFVFDFPIDSMPYEILLSGWSEDDFFDHTISFWIEHTPATVGLLHRLFTPPSPAQVQGA